MPGQDGTGPLGQGPLTGRGLGPCGRRISRGKGIGFGRRTINTTEEKDLLKEDLKDLKA